eukprot:symbB.v1.2.018006.t1/scaffold1420.1/size119762/4
MVPWPFLVLCFLGSAAAAQPQRFRRQCRERDWQFAFGKCHEEKRNVYPYTRFCTPNTTVPPLLNVPCKESCPAGKHLGVKLHNSNAELKCLNCSAGKFSLGGGLLISGFAGDWHKSWPVGLRSSCSYTLPDGSMQHGQGSTTGLSGACEMQVLAPEAVAGRYLVLGLLGAGKDASKVTRPPVAMIFLAPGDRRLCTRPRRGDIFAPHNRRLQKQATRTAGSKRPGRQRGQPGQAQGAKVPGFQRFWLLAAMGGCPIRTKAAAAAAVGAEGVLLASPAAVAFGAGDMYRTSPPNTAGARNFNVTRVAPAFIMLEDRDSQLLASGIRTLNEVILVNNTAMLECATKRRAPPPDATETRAFGCEAWVPDELGTSIHSGANRRFNRMVSTLELTVNIVREHGYVLFRYQVDSEEGFDGLRFEVDWSEAMPAVSRQLTWKELRVNLTQGSHFLRWQYIKDASDAVGMDRAQLQLVQVVGTSFSDLECFPCHGSGTHSAGGAAHCNACGANEFLIRPGADLSQCRPCPAGRWSMPGAVGQGSCKALLNCTAADVEVSLTTCIKGKQQEKRTWLQPIHCNVNATGAHALLTSGKIQPCTSCEPNTARSTSGSGACRPKTLTCAPGQFAVTQLVYEKWEEWPQNLSQEVITASGEEAANGTLPGGWRLRPNNQTGIGVEHLVSDELESRLHLDVNILPALGRVEFRLDMNSLSEWGSGIQFLVDNVEASHLYGLQVNRSSLPQRWKRYEVSALLHPGIHRLTWRSLYPAQSQAEGRMHLMHLKRVLVEGAAGAGATHCLPCPAGQEVVPPGNSCQSCRPGSYFKQAGRRCHVCPPGTFTNTEGATVCQRCPTGTFNLRGLRCMAKVMLSAREGIKSSSRVHGFKQVTVNASAAVAHWKQATDGLNGPFLVAGRKFLINVERPIESDDGEAFLWEVGSQECRSNATSLMSITAPVVALPPLSTPVGIHLSAVEAVARNNVRGVRFTWVKRRDLLKNFTTNRTNGSFDLKATLKNFVACSEGSTAATQDLNYASLLLRCDAMAPLKPLARSDANGNVHLDGLRMAGNGK